LLCAAALVACGACTSTPPAKLEDVRAAGRRIREREPGKPVGGQGTLAEAKSFAASGESEEIDFWRLTSVPSSAELAELRAAQWAAGRAPGLYTMRDVLGFNRYLPGAGGRPAEVAGMKDGQVILKN
jgi:hypothetical protein